LILPRLEDLAKPGKHALRVYFAKALAAAPELKFDLLDVFASVNSVVVYLRSNVRAPSRGQ